MKIVGITDYNTFFVHSTIGWAVEDLGKILNCETRMYSYEQLKDKNIGTDDQDDILLFFEIGNPQHAGVTTSDMRQWYPNAKFIAFCSDTIYYEVNNLPRQMDPNGIDLHLEIMPQCLNTFLRQGIHAEFWAWTGSERIFKLAEEYKNTHTANKQFDFIGVYHQTSIDNPISWRHHVIKFLRENGRTFTRGNGSGHDDRDIYNLFQVYMDSWFTLGTTSHNRLELTLLGCMKGFRDWLGPVLGNILIYDGHKNILDVYGDKLMPLYNYNNPYSILECYNYYKNIPEYNDIAKMQRDWAFENTIEKQLIRILTRRGWIT